MSVTRSGLVQCWSFGPGLFQFFQLNWICSNQRQTGSVQSGPVRSGLFQSGLVELVLLQSGTVGSGLFQSGQAGLGLFQSLSVELVQFQSEAVGTGSVPVCLVVSLQTSGVTPGTS